MEKIKTKKADPTDIILMLVIVFFLVVSLVVALYANSKIKEVIDTTVLNSTDAYPSITSSFNTINTLTVQRGFVLMFGLLIIGMLVSSFMIKVHPVFIFIYIFTLATAIFTAIYLANTYEMVIASPQLSALATNYEMMTWVMKNIVMILLGTGALSMVIIFSKIFGGGETGSPL